MGISRTVRSVGPASFWLILAGFLSTGLSDELKDSDKAASFWSLKESIHALAFSPNSKLMFTGGSKGAALWDLTTLVRKSIFQAPELLTRPPLPPTANGS